MTRVQDYNTKTGELTPHYSLAAAYGLWFLTGLFGGHWFYLGRPRLAIAYLLTAGLLGIGWLVDFVNMPDYVRLKNHTS